MAPPKGNQFWKVRSSHGRKPIFKDEEQLWDACIEYFEWVDANPLNEEKLVSYQGDTKREAVAKMRAMTISGLCIFLDISQSTWFEYAKKDDFSKVTLRAEEIIRTQKFEGASAGLLNANIIARDLGLADKTDINHSGAIETMSEEQVDARLAELSRKEGDDKAPGAKIPDQGDEQA